MNSSTVNNSFNILSFEHLPFQFSFRNLFSSKLVNISYLILSKYLIPHFNYFCQLGSISLSFFRQAKSRRRTKNLMFNYTNDFTSKLTLKLVHYLPNVVCCLLNLSDKEAYTKRWQTYGKSLYCALKMFFPAHQKNCTAHQKNILCTAKNSICTAKQQLAYFLILQAYF